MFGFNPKVERKVHQNYSISLYGESLDTKIPVIKINTIDDLAKYSIITKSIKE
jgi:hypothetical protein